MTKWIIVALFTLAPVLTQAKKVPVIPAETMTCADAIEFYEIYRRIYVYAGGGDIVPIYGLTPRSKWRELKCKGRSVRSYYLTETRDDKSCAIGWHCRSK